MAVLTPTEILGLFVLYGVHFLPIAIIFLMGWIRYSVYRSKTRHAVRHRDAVAGPELDFAHFTKSDRGDYDAHRRDNKAVLPFAVYLCWMLVNAGIEATAMFLVWFDVTAYPTWVYQTSMGLQFAIVLVKLFWVLAFFDETSYRAAALASGMLLVLDVTNFIIVIQSDVGIVYNWVLDALVVLFYLYTFLLMVHFYHVSGRTRHYHGDKFVDKIDVFGMMFGPNPAARSHGVHVDPQNVRHRRDNE